MQKNKGFFSLETLKSKNNYNSLSKRSVYLLK